MHESRKISILLCVFGFLKNIRPSDSYYNEFLLGPWRNITADQIYRDILPIGTYSYLLQLIIIFLITDFLRYKPIMIISELSGIIGSCLSIWTTSLQWLQIAGILFGTYLASEVAYFTYIYAKVDKEFYREVTSHTRAALLFGKFTASVMGQILLNYKLFDYKELNYITLAAQIAAILWILALPNVQSSLYFHLNDTKKYLAMTDNNQIKKISAIQLIWSHFKTAYTNLNVIRWSVWYALILCGYLQVDTYNQVLWKSIEETPSVVWNGAVQAVLTLLSAICALLAGYVNSTRLFRIKNMNIIILAILSIVEGCILLLSIWTRDLYYSYIAYVIVGAISVFSITITSAEVVKYLEEDSFALVFGINTLIGLLLQAILTLLVTSDFGFQLNVFDQYIVYSFYFIIIGLIYIFCTSIEILLKYFK